MDLELTKSEKNDIAEFIFSYKSDILIKSDAEKVIELFKNKGVPGAEGLELYADEVSEFINKTLSSEEIESIMKAYYSGGL